MCRIIENNVLPLTYALASWDPLAYEHTFMGQRIYSHRPMRIYSWVGESLSLSDGFAGEPDPQFLENLVVHLAEHDGGMRLTTIQLR